MTLIVGGIEGHAAWMCADAAISDPTAAVRTRSYRPKIEMVGSSALLGFAGPVHAGSAALSVASNLEPGEPTLSSLLGRHREDPEVEFLYSYLKDDQPQLARVANGAVTFSSSLFVGDQLAYEKFQEVRLERVREHAPEAIHRLISAGYGDEKIPEGLHEAIHSMLSQFATTEDRSVGGWASPYMLTSGGPSMCTYGYSVTDPIAKVLTAGQEVPHGTAEGGGFSLSYCPLRELDGVVVYWLQRPGGKVFIRKGQEYAEHDFIGSPAEFKAAVLARLGRNVDLWFDNSRLGTPSRVDVIRDENGEPRMFVAKSGNVMSFSWANNPKGSFSSRKTLDVSDVPAKQRDDFLGGKGMKITVSEDADTLKFSAPTASLNLTAAEVDALISALAMARIKLKDQVPSEIAPDTQLEAIVDPAWRTRPAPHPAVPGPLLILRHPGHGWQPFILPRHEAKALGQWLTKHIEETEVLPVNSTIEVKE